MAQAKKKLSSQKSKQVRTSRIRSVNVDTDEIPELDESFWNDAQVGGPLRKRLISLRLDGDVIDWFKDNGPNYQTKMNQVLRTYVLWMQKQSHENRNQYDKEK